MWYPPCRPALVPSNGSPLASACLMPPPYPPTLRPRHLIVSSHRSCLAACRSLRASPLLRPVIDVGACVATVPWRLATRPASSTRRAGRYDGAVAVLSAPLACPSARHLIRAFGIGWRRGCSLLSPMDIIGAACYPLARPIRFPRRPAASSPPSLITRHGGRGGGPWFWLLAFAVRFHLQSICVGSVYCGGGGCLACLGVVLCMLSMG